MFHVAVILNESETQRYGWANILPVLETAAASGDYSFDSYTVANIDDFFYRWRSYDSAFISTNACNDEALYTKLCANRALVADFIASGKGLFISFQKRLADRSSLTGFLPEQYEYSIVGREESSADGSISKPKRALDTYLLTFPKPVTVEQVMYRCRHNSFKEHLYRGLIVPEHPYNYTPVLVDSSYGSDRSILVSSRADLGARIVASTMSLDWEGHVDLLSNILTFVTEGPPLVAFVRKKNVDNLDYEYLVSSTKFHKIPCRVYELDSISVDYPPTLHKFYVLGIGWTEADAVALWSRVTTAGIDCRVYLFRKIDDVPALVAFSAYSLTERVMTEALTWINSRYREGAWQSSFWITHDVIEMMHGLGLRIDLVKQGVLEHWKRHDKDGSFDGLMGSTCGLLEMYAWLLGKTSGEYRQTLRWIRNNLSRASDHDKQTAIITLARLGEEYDAATYEHVYNVMCRVPWEARLRTPELDVCRNVEVLLPANVLAAQEWLRVLSETQAQDGMWGNAARTAGTAAFLMAHRDELIDGMPGIDEMIYKAISYLSSEYGHAGDGWYGDVLTTAKAVYAFKLFESLLEYPVDDTFSSIRHHCSGMSSVQTAQTANAAIEQIRLELAEASEENSRKAAILDYYQSIAKRYQWLKTCLLFGLVVLSALSIYIINKKLTYVLTAFVRDLRYVVPAVLLFVVTTVVTVAATRIAERRVFIKGDEGRFSARSTD